MRQSARLVARLASLCSGLVIVASTPVAVVRKVLAKFLRHFHAVFFDPGNHLVPAEVLLYVGDLFVHFSQVSEFLLREIILVCKGLKFGFLLVQRVEEVLRGHGLSDKAGCGLMHRNTFLYAWKCKDLIERHVGEPLAQRLRRGAQCWGVQDGQEYRERGWDLLAPVHVFP
jgi:hypothetical protein